MKTKLFKNLNDLKTYLGDEEYRHQMYNYYEVDTNNTKEVTEVLNYYGLNEVVESLTSDYMIIAYTPQTLIGDVIDNFSNYSLQMIRKDNCIMFDYDGNTYKLTLTQCLKMIQDNFRRITVTDLSGENKIVISK